MNKRVILFKSIIEIKQKYIWTKLYESSSFYIHLVIN